MAAVGEPGRESDSDDPYVRLGLSQDATFEQVQAAKARCIAEVDGDDQARARVEAAYDSVLMARLRDRQQGQVSPAAATASVSTAACRSRRVRPSMGSLPGRG